MYVTFVLSPLLLPRLALIYYHRGRKTAHMIQVIKFPMEKREVLLETAIQYDLLHSPLIMSI